MDDPWQIHTVKLYHNYAQLELAKSAQSEVAILWLVAATALAIMWLVTLLTPVVTGRKYLPLNPVALTIDYM